MTDSDTLRAVAPQAAPDKPSAPPPSASAWCVRSVYVASTDAPQRLLRYCRTIRTILARAEQLDSRAQYPHEKV